MNSEDIQNIFFAECEEALEAAESGLDACKAGTQDDETINAIFRGVHSIKGGAGAFGHTRMQTFTHCFETLLADVREGEVPLEEDLVDLMLLALDCLRDHVDAALSQSEPPNDGPLMERLIAEQAVNRAEAADAGPVDEPTPIQEKHEDTAAKTADDGLDDLLNDLMLADEPSWLVHFRPHAGAMRNGSEPLVWLRELTELGGECVNCDLEQLPSLADFNINDGYLGWTVRMPGTVSREQVEELFDFAGENCSLAFGDDAQVPPVQLIEREEEVTAPAPKKTESKPAAKAPAPSATPSAPPSSPAPAVKDRKRASSSAGQSLRIDLEKLDRMIDGVGELVIAQAMLTQRLANENLAHIEELGMLDTLVRDIQEHAMAFRAQPISSVFSRVPKLLRELAGSTGKHVKLEVTGETTELDKTVVERLSEPLTHLIRNAVDHGIEDVERRLAAGKEAEGTLSLSAEQKAGRILIRIADDGRGLDREKLRNKAVANGVISEDAQLSDEEIHNLVFAAGLSTAKEVSNVSGRGVGMDVVRQNVKDLGGRITIESVPGEGTTFVLALPLTLAISDGMIVQVGEQSLVIPLAHVVESMRPEPGDIKGLGTTHQMLNVRGRFVPILPLCKITDRQAQAGDTCDGVLVIIETEAHGQAALLVDVITDQRQFVIKSLDTNFRSIESVAGATILGNGRVALIVDVDSLVQEAAAVKAVPKPAAPIPTAAQAPVEVAA
ncbi:chemotaxis protein CheA [Qipengyuania sp. DGS5-3]|uniref:chemotaxis protein CheA n=1 Tax=Qipengyuania sp. DGS5-3 TaxID=3349632 RepID=UPI0036D2E2FB